MSRPTIRKNGKPLTDAERSRRKRDKRKRQLKAEQEAARTTRRLTVTTGLGILARDIRAVSEADLPSASVDAVITDPPYARDAVPLYGDLAGFALRVLKPGGWCLTMAGDFYLDRIMALLTDAGLAWRGEMFIAFPGGNHSRLHEMRMFQQTRPVLVLQKPPLSRPAWWGSNTISVSVGEWIKDLHPWQQSQPAFEKLVARFTLPGDLVADPFAGSGTTLRAALTLGRRAWGCDVDCAGRLTWGDEVPKAEAAE